MIYKSNKFDDQIIKILNAGGVGLLPSDTVYGLSCLALNEPAVEKLRSLKGRDQEKSFIILISDLQMLNQLSILPQSNKLIEKYWPGPLTIVMEGLELAPWLDNGSHTLALRMPANKALRDLIAKTGPLISTSANLAGQATIKDAKTARKIFADALDFYVDDGEITDGQPSTIVKLSKDKIEILRQGDLIIKEKK